MSKKRKTQKFSGNPGDNTIMRELPMCEQPYERCLEYGPEALSDAELLSVIIRTGSPGERAADLAIRILKAVPGECLSGLFEVSTEQLQEIHGIGKVKAIQLKCMAECSRRMIQFRWSGSPLCCDTPEAVAAYFMQQMRFLETEQVRLLILNGKNMLQKELILSNGSFNSSLASPREIFYYALKHKAVHILLLHNHPSGDPTPSSGDFTVTRRVYDSGQLLGIPLLDHIIIGDNRFISFRKEGYLTEQ